MWKRPWGAREGASICLGLVVMGLLMQVAAGGVEWSNFQWPFNLIVLSIYIIILGTFHLLRRRIYPVRWATTQGAAVPSIAGVALVTLIMGLARQDPSSGSMLGHMLEAWPLVLLYWWMSAILGLTILKGLGSMSLRKAPSMLFHLGLFIVLMCGTLGSADMQRVRMSVKTGQTEWRATDGKGRLVQLPLAIELIDFEVDEYPPKLMIIDNLTGRALPEGRPEQLSLDEEKKEGDLCGWHVKLRELIDMAASNATEDTIIYVEWPTVGATNAAYIEAVGPDGIEKREGWVSCGSFLFPYQALKLDSALSIVMPDREPRRFTSQVKLYTESGLVEQRDIEVNHPAKAEGWKIYQLSYDKTKGRWSDVSEFELVSDPWLPAVYVGIFLMLLGAILMFITANISRKEAAE